MSDSAQEQALVKADQCAVDSSNVAYTQTVHLLAKLLSGGKKCTLVWCVNMVNFGTFDYTRGLLSQLSHQTNHTVKLPVQKAKLLNYGLYAKELYNNKNDYGVFVLQKNYTS